MMAIGAFFFSCQNDMEVLREIGEEGTEAFQTVYNGTYKFTEMGNLRNTLYAAKIEQFVTDTDYVVASGGLFLEIYNRAEQLSAQLKADSGLYFEKQSRMEAYNNVIFCNVKGDSLFTEHLVWESDSNLVWTEDKVRIVRDEGVINGRGLRAKDDFSRYTILAPSGELEVPDQTQGHEPEEDQ